MFISSFRCVNRSESPSLGTRRHCLFHSLAHMFAIDSPYILMKDTCVTDVAARCAPAVSMFNNNFFFAIRRCVAGHMDTLTSVCKQHPVRLHLVHAVRAIKLHGHLARVRRLHARPRGLSAIADVPALPQSWVRSILHSHILLLLS
jgi:hypothetical protein